jgi:hypothetical protein
MPHHRQPLHLLLQLTLNLHVYQQQQLKRLKSGRCRRKKTRSDDAIE